METYTEFKNGGWMGLIPDSWQIRRISSLYDPRNEKVSDKDYPALSVTMQGILPQLETAAKTQDGDNRKLVKKGDFAINSRSDRRGSCGISAYDGSVSLITNVLAPRANVEMSNQFFEYLFRSTGFSDEYYKHGTGIVDDLWSTNWSRMKNIQIAVPPIGDQIAIVAFLDEKVGKLDETVAEIERSIELLQEYRQSVISEAVTRGLDSTVPMKDSGIEWIGEIPEHWKMQRARFTISRFRKGSGIKKDEVTSSGDIACVRYGEIYSHYSEKVSEIRSRTFEASIASPQYVTKGNLLFACTGELVEEIGRNVLFDSEEPCLVGGDVIIAEHDQHASFLNYSLGSYCAQCQKSFGKAKLKVVHISANEIDNVRMPLPPLEEQEAISDYLDEKLSEIDMLITDKQKQVGLLKEYRRSLISEAVTGKFKVPGLE